MRERIHAFNLNTIYDSKKAIQILSHNISAEKKIKISKFHNQKDALRSLIGEKIVYLHFVEFIGKTKEFNLKYNFFGKPYLDSEYKFNFNISHSGDWVVVAFSEKDIGIDVEEIKDIDYSIADQVLTPLELEYFSKINDLQKSDYFFCLWTMKESYLKCIGKGLSKSLKSIEISVHKEQIYLEDKEIPDQKVYIKSYDLDPNYKLSVCSSHNKIPEKIEILDSKILLE